MFGFSKLEADVKQIKEWVLDLRRGINELHCKTSQKAPACKCSGVSEDIPHDLTYMESLLVDIKESLDNTLDGTDPGSSINCIHEKLNQLIEKDRTIDAVSMARANLDKFDDYMKNVDKLNAMMNEFKGCVAMARASLQVRNSKEEILTSEKPKRDRKTKKPVDQ